MAQLKIRLKLNQGRRGAPLSKLGKIAEQADRFLRALADDCEVDSRPGEWLAVEFENGSVAYDAEFQGDVTPAVASIFAHNLESLADYDPDGDGLNLAISSGTALEYARIGSLIDPDESIGLGIYRTDTKKPNWRQITYKQSASLRREIEIPLPSYGAVQGILHAWFKEAKEPNFQLRELSTDCIVKVFYAPPLYADVAKAVQERSTVLIVTGDMLFDRATRAATELRADKIDRVGMLSSAEFESFFGSAPDFIADDAAVDG
jgi:hypothetical protein